MTDRELDAKIQKEIIRPSPFPPVLDVFGHIQEEHIPFYSTSIKAAWDVVLHMEKEGFEFSIESNLFKYNAEFSRNGDSFSANWYESAPKAICLASLKAVGGGVKA